MKQQKQRKDDIVYLVPEEPPRSPRVSFLWVSLIIGFALCCFLSFALWKNSVLLVRYTRDNNNNCNSPACSGIPDSDKFDCHPEGGATQEKCVQRGCCYQSKGVPWEGKDYPPLNVPYCYYPSNYEGYSVEQSVRLDGRQITAKLKRNAPSGYPKDIQNLDLVITFIDDQTIRVKVCIS